MRLKGPVPNALTSSREVGDYVCRQTIFAAQTFMLAAESAGLSTVPMEGFDEGRVKKLLKIPRSMRVPLIIVVGYKAPDFFVPVTPRLDLSEKVSLNQFPNKLARPG
jgi:nitroreductase